MSTPRDNVDSSDAIMLLREIFNGGATVPAANSAPDSSATVDATNNVFPTSLTEIERVSLMMYVSQEAIDLAQHLLMTKDPHLFPLAKAMKKLMDALCEDID